jgi:hypothetical protein
MLPAKRQRNGLYLDSCYWVLDCKHPQPWMLLATAEAEAKDGAKLDLYRTIVTRAFSELASCPEEEKLRSLASRHLEAKALFLPCFQQLIAEAGFSLPTRPTTWTLQRLYKNASLALRSVFRVEYDRI